MQKKTLCFREKERMYKMSNFRRYVPTTINVTLHSEKKKVQIYRILQTNLTFHADSWFQFNVEETNGQHKIRVVTTS